MVTYRNFTHSEFYDVPSTVCSYMIDYMSEVNHYARKTKAVKIIERSCPLFPRYTYFDYSNVKVSAGTATNGQRTGHHQ